MTELAAVAFKVALFIGIIGAAVVFHELGHFLAARVIGVKVEVFSFGFGRRLFGWRVGDTDYRVSLIPLGGYVRMRGDSGDGQDGPPPPDSLEGRRTWEQLLIMGMGPVFNFVLAIGLLSAVFMVGYRVPAFLSQPVVVEFVEPGSPAAAAGLQVGDRIVAAAGRAMPDWERFRQFVLLHPGRDVDLVVEREGEAARTVAVEITRTGRHAVGHLGVHPCYEVTVGTVSEGGPAAAAGLAPGDVLVRVAGQAPCTAPGLVALLQSTAGDAVPVRVRRDDLELELRVEPRWHEPQERWVIGIGPREAAPVEVLARLRPLAALERGVVESGRLMRLIADTVVRLVSGRLSPRVMSGPLEIADIAEQTWDDGADSLVRLVAVISLNLGILNLLPIPGLDGGRIFLLLVEAVRGRALATRTKDWILQLGFVMLVALMGLVLFLDLIKKLEG